MTDPVPNPEAPPDAPAYPPEVTNLVAAATRYADARRAVQGYIGDLTGAEFEERCAAWRSETTALANATAPFATPEETTDA